jgi:hypothetical protein
LVFGVVLAASLTAACNGKDGTAPLNPIRSDAQQVDARAGIHPTFLAHQYFRLMDVQLREDPKLRERYEKAFAEALAAEIKAQETAVTRELDQNDRTQLSEGKVLLIASSEVVHLKEPLPRQGSGKNTPLFSCPPRLTRD